MEWDIMLNTKISVLTSKKQFITLIAILSLLIAAGGYFYYKSQLTSIRQEKYNELKAIADLKVNQIQNWINDRRADVIAVTRSPFFIGGVNQWLKDTGNVQLKQEIIERLRLIQKEHGFENIFLAAPNDRLLLSVITISEGFHSIRKQIITEAGIKKEVVFTDLYSDQIEKKIHYDIIAPIINGNKTIAILLFRLDPNDYLYPLIQTWPIPSKSAETVLFRTENDSVLVLNELRFHRNSALKLKISLTRTENPAVEGALGRTGLFEGTDYRGVEVLSDIRIIPGTNWILVAKIDKSEIYSDQYFIAGIISGFSIFLIIICGIGFGFIYSSRQKNIFMELYNKEKELWQSQEKFKVTMDSLGDGVITTNSDGKIQYINKIAEELTDWSLREARGRTLREVYSVKNEETGEKENNILHKVIKEGIVKELANHTILISKSGKEIPVMDTGAPIYDNDGSITGIVIVFQDETEKRSQLKLIKENEFRLRSTLDNMMEGCQIIGFDYRYLFLNKTAFIQSRITKEGIIGKIMMECYPGIENTEMFSVLRRCMEERISAVMVNEFSYSDNIKRHFQLRFEPVPEGVFILSEDITERKQTEDTLKESDERFRSLFENSTMGLYRTTPQGDILLANPTLIRMLGYDNIDELAQRNLEQNGYELDYPRSKFQSEIEKSGGIIGLESKWTKKDGTTLDVNESAHAIRGADGNVLYYDGTVEDITKRKKAEEELIIANKELVFQNEEKEKRAVELLAAKEKAEEMTRLKSNFLANMSHELRTPLIGINGFSDVLRQDIENPELKEMAEIIFNSGSRLSETLNLILDLSKLESGNMVFTYQQIDLVSEAEKIISLFKEAARKKGLYLKSSYNQPSIFINIDPRAFHSILNNLINNAIKYTNEGGIAVDISLKDIFVEIKVIDCGIGIAKEYHEIIFDEFRQVSEGYSRNFEGTGLGLNITMKLVKKFGGEISVESEPGKGSTFIVKLPVTNAGEIAVEKNVIKKAPLAVITG
jgi:PAS domain S-box-containing protein